LKAEQSERKPAREAARIHPGPEEKGKEAVGGGPEGTNFGTQHEGGGGVKKLSDQLEGPAQTKGTRDPQKEKKGEKGGKKKWQH